jgi:hypothetical protein
MSYTDVFGGNLIFPSQLSYLMITTAVDVTLQWPTEQQITGDSVVADVMDVDTTAPSLNVDMPDARNTSTGNKATFNNRGANSFTVRDNTGGTIQQVLSGEQWVVVLTDNSTQAGIWTTFQLGGNAATPASASGLAGAGLKAISALLNQKIDSDIEAATPFTAVDGDRAKCLVYIAGAGTCNLPSPGVVGNDWFFMLHNGGSGTLNVLPPSGQIDSGASINLDPQDSCFIFTDGTDFFTVGLSSGSTIAFDFVSIPIPGSGDFVLSGANLNRIAYRFTGALTGNRRIVVPNTTQQYWVDNQTTNAFTLEIDTAAGAGIFVTQGQSLIVYCDGTDVINASSSTSIGFPITIGQGGTGATDAATALANLGGVATTFSLVAGDGMAGGGDLSSSPRTFDFDLTSIVSAAPAVGDFLAFEDIDNANVNRKATITDILALGFPGITIEDEGVPLATVADTLDFVGAGVVASGVGSTKTITISGGIVAASGAAGRMLRGDGAGEWADAGTLATLSAGGILGIGRVELTSGADVVTLAVIGGTCFLTSSGGVITDFQTDEDWRFLSGVIYLAETAIAPSQLGGFGALYSDGPHVTGLNPNTMMFRDDAGNDYRLDGLQRRATLADQSRTSDATPTSIANWSNFHVPPARRWKGRAVIWYDQNGGDITVVASYSQTPEEIGQFMWQAQDAAGVFDSDVGTDFETEIDITTMTNGQLSCLIWEFSFQSHDTLVGNLEILFSQASVSGAATTIREPSFFELAENDNIS